MVCSALPPTSLRTDESEGEGEKERRMSAPRSPQPAPDARTDKGEKEKRASEFWHVRAHHRIYQSCMEKRERETEKGRTGRPAGWT